MTELAAAEDRLKVRLPASLREWYSNPEADSILKQHSNSDPPIPVREFAVEKSPLGPLLPIRSENQGVCTWAVALDGSDDPPVFIDVDSRGTEWQRVATTFSAHVRPCVWDHRIVLGRPALVAA